MSRLDFALISDLESRFKDYFVGELHFERQRFSFRSKGTREAINRYETPMEKVKAMHWFDDIYLYVKIDFYSIGKGIFAPFISNVFFQEVEGELEVLFRAEWDNYLNGEKVTHPQPHWHFTHSVAVEKTMTDLQNMEDDSPFHKLMEEHKKETLNLTKIHFAMNGFSPTIISDESDNEMLVTWFYELYEHVRAEINYIR